ncbi:hypothetical protein QBC44DRAFT_232211 [Cladorrhinum sp. PSN332]|nr:hypothetical protein QBC44DRAFT_232211 [Cladorrhinum sp. PSN332]
MPPAGPGAAPPPPPATAPPSQQHHHQSSHPHPHPHPHSHPRQNSHPHPHPHSHPHSHPHPQSHPQPQPQPHPHAHAHAHVHAHQNSHPPAHHPQHDLALDSTIKFLLDQREEIQARLAVLLPQKYGPNTKLESEMLRHKLRVLRAYADDNQLSDKIPILSHIEEARTLQYHCECIETACLEHGVDLHDPRFLDVLKYHYFRDQAPEGYGAWLDRNINHYDPVAQAFRLRDSLPLSFRTHHSYKCSDERCMHYIYGYPLDGDRDQHAKEHVVPYKRDSALSVGDTPTMPFPEQPSRAYGPEFNSNGKRPASPPYLPRPAPNIQLAPIATGSQTKDHQNTLRSYSFVPEYPAGHRGSVDSEVDPLLPPLKRSRVGQSRLESIGELKLLRDTGPCLRCRVSKQGCDSNDPCGFCGDQAGSPENDFWKALGCHRGPLASLVDMIIPASISPRHTQTPLTSPLAIRRNMNEFLERSFVVPPEITRMVKSHLDFDDGFWWTEDLASLPPANPTLASYSKEPVERPPPILSALAASWNMNGNMYNFWQLLKLSGVISGTRETEAVRYPVLYRAKLLLRETLFYDLQQHEPMIHGEPSSSTTHVIFDDADLYGRFQVLCSCMMQFLQAFDSQMTRPAPLEPKNWLAVFVSLCIFSIVKTLLIDRAAQSRVGSSTQPPTAAMHAVYKALVNVFATSTPTLLDGPEVEMSGDDRELLVSVNALLGGNSWAERGIQTTKDFLIVLGSGESVDGAFYNGFLKQRPSPRQGSFALPPFSKPGEEARKPLPDIRPLSNPWSQGQPDKDMYVFKNESDRMLSSPQAMDLVRRHTVAESPSYTTHGSRGLTSPITAPPLRPTTYQRPQVRRVFCGKCNEYPEGFRGEHELRRHTDAKHAPLLKRYICSEPLDPSGSPLPVIPLKKCRACVSRKKYGAYYNAAAHLRRAHFNPQRGGKTSGDWPPMTILKDWMREIEVQQSMGGQDQDDASSDDEAEPYKSAHEFVPPSHRRSPVLETGPPRLAPAPPPHHQPTSHGLPPLAPSYDRPPPNPPPLIIQSAFLTPTPALKGDTLRSEALKSEAHRVEEQHSSPSSSTATRSRCPHPECGRVFKDLSAHMLTHLEERPEKCPIESCEYHTKGFARKYDKNRHALTHYKGTMVCPFCPGAGTNQEKAFNRADVFKRHLTAVHNVEQTPPNSRKLIVTPGTSRSDGLGARCSICHSQFATAQEFYEHLDECVLNVIVPSTPQPAAGGSRNGSISEMKDSTTQTHTTSRTDKGKEVDANPELRQTADAKPSPQVDQSAEQPRKESAATSVPDSPLSPPPEVVTNPYLEAEAISETVSEIQVETGYPKAADKDDQLEAEEADESGGPPQLNPRPYFIPKVTLGSPIPPDAADTD